MQTNLDIGFFLFILACALCSLGVTSNYTSKVFQSIAIIAMAFWFVIKIC